MAQASTKRDMDKIFGMIILAILVSEAVPIALDNLANLSGDGVGYTMLSLLGLVIGAGVLYLFYSKFM